MNDELTNQLFTDQVVRRESARQSHILFFHMYFYEYVQYPTADFQKTIFKLTEKINAPEIFIMAFRGSAKTTILSNSYPIWAIIGIQQKKFVVIVSQTQSQSRQILNNIRRELESNDLLKKDFGPFTDGKGEWSTSSLELTKYGARITAVSTGESIRGLRHGPHRPDLIILDDVEDINSVKTLDNRQNIFRWFTSEVKPLGDIGTRIIVVGNLLHEDSLMMKLKEYDNVLGKDSVFVSFPLVNEEGEILWPQKYTHQKIAEMRREMIDSGSFEREYLLQIVPDDQQVIQREWIKKYNFILPTREVLRPRMVLIAIDLAIKKGDGRDFTAMVPMYLTGYDKTLQAYVLPNIINKQLDFPETVEAIKKLSAELKETFGIIPRIFVESVGYQDAVVQQLFLVEKLMAEPVSVGHLDKVSRLRLVSPYVQLGKVFFPEFKAETLINQLLNIHSTKHDDLADAFTIGLSKIIESDQPYYPSRIKTEDKPHYAYNEITGQWHDLSKPYTAGMLDMVY